jgi:hypothetical protein
MDEGNPENTKQDELAALPEYLSNHVPCPRASVSACFGGDNGLDLSLRAIIDAHRINTADLFDDEEREGIGVIP